MIARTSRLLVAAACAGLAACAHPVIATSPAPAQRDALLILTGFGYGHDATRVFRAERDAMLRDGLDVYVPKYIERGGLTDSRAELLEFYRENHLDRYARLHVFAFIAGAWTLNPLLAQKQLPNVVTVIYDRSPLQERAPRIADERLHFLTWVRYGQPVFQLAHSPYTPMVAPNIRVGLVVETRPTSLVRRYEKVARSYGPFQFGCDSFGQRYDDCIYAPMSHDEMYTRFDSLRAEILAFIHFGRFTDAASRSAPTADPFAK